MQNITIKAGTSAKFTITPKINDSVATAEQLNGVVIYMFFVYQFTNQVYYTYELTGDSYTGAYTINLSPSDTISMLGNAEENQKYEIQFAIKTANGDVIAEDNDSGILVNVVRWEAGTWINENRPSA
jgi:hypothetical protein